MKCPFCNAWSIVKETRNSPTFGHTRRRECGNEHRFTTKEVVIPQEEIDAERKLNLEQNQLKSTKPKAVKRPIYRGI
jgi:transcriptional regulator NrdR family protein